MVDFEGLIGIGKEDVESLLAIIKRELEKEGLQFNNIESQIKDWLEKLGETHEHN